MKKREITELHTKTETDLTAMLKELRSSLAVARLDKSQQKLTNTSSLTNMRVDIARVLTVLSIKTRAAEQVVEGGKV